MENTFVLPEKWCVERTRKNYGPINKWFNEQYHPKQPFSGYNVKNGCKYWHHPRLTGFWTYYTPQHRLITYEQFLQYVVGNSQTYSIY